MTERIDHAAEAQKHVGWAHEQQGEEGRFDETVQHNATLAVAEATLALVEQQRITNLFMLHAMVPVGHLTEKARDELDKAFPLHVENWEEALS